MNTVEQMRKELRSAIRVEGRTSFVMPKYPFKFEEDVVAVHKIIENLRERIVNFDGPSTSSAYKKITTLLIHVMGRLERSLPSSEEERVERSKLLLALSRIETDLQDKLKPERQSTPVRDQPLDFSFLAAGNITANDGDNVTDNETSGEEDTVVGSSCKPVPVNLWKLKFSGSTKGFSVHGFLERAEELRIARNVSKEQLFRSAVDLFEDKALIWYRANRQSFRDWEDLVTKLKQAFLSPDFDDKLFEEIRKRTQGKNENISLYAAVMSSLFSRLSVNVPEETKLKILLKNIAPFYQSQLALTHIKSVSELVSLCQRLEDRKQAIEQYVPPPRHFSTFEPELAYIDTASVSSIDNINRSASATSTLKSFPSKSLQSRSCWNCGQVGHQAKACTAERRMYCYKCKNPGVTVRTCKVCNPGNGK